MKSHTEQHKPMVALSQGDPAGIGPEICLKAINDRAVRDACRPVIIGDRHVLEQVAERLELTLPTTTLAPQDWFDEATDAPTQGLERIWKSTEGPLLLDCGQLTGIIEPGQPTAQAGEVSYRYITAAARGAMQGVFDAMATAPITKLTLDMAGIDGPGHTEILARLIGATDYVMMLYSPRIVVTLVTIHQSLRSVPDALTPEAIVRVACLTRETMRDLLGREPRLAVLGLNPHAGEGGLFGREDIEIVAPAVEQCRRQGLDIEGPLPPDAAFMPHNLERFDAHVALYHDQGLIPFKMISLHDGVNTTLGLPIVRTSPDHGTAYDIAWQGKADPSSMVAAILLAARLAEQRRLRHREPCS